MTDKEIKLIIRKILNYELSLWDVPEEAYYHKNVLKAARKHGLLKDLNRGFDVIHNCFFVEGEIFEENSNGELESNYNKVTFSTFEEYYAYLDGDIYDSACYKYCDIDKYIKFINEKNIDIIRFWERKTFLTETVDDLSLKISKEELDAYDAAENNKKLIVAWIKKFETCASSHDLELVVKRYDKSVLKNVLDVSFFFFCYIFKDEINGKRFNSLMEYVCTGKNIGSEFVKALCTIYNPNDVIERYNLSGLTKNARYIKKKRLRDYVQLLKVGKIEIKTSFYFDDKTHFYCEETKCFEEGRNWESVSYKRCFETFEEFAKYRKDSLKGVDLTNAIRLDVDFSLYKTDEKTKLPLRDLDDLICEIRKEYIEGNFVVSKEWKTSQSDIIKKKSFSTPYFFDFVYYLQGNLSDSFLLFCDGLENLSICEEIDFSRSRMTSKMCDKFGIPYEGFILDRSAIGSFAITEKNEEEKLYILDNSENIELAECDEDMHFYAMSDEYDGDSQVINYITDIHLMHRLQNAKCKSKDDVEYVLQKIANRILKEKEGFLLIGGDVSSDFSVFKRFIELLRWKLDCKKWRKNDIVFVLGNHELWGFSKKSIEEIVTIYRNVIEKNGMQLLHNEILYTDSTNKICKISYNELISKSSKDLRTQIQSTRIVIVGGLAFSGYNEEFNANHGIYRETLDRKGEIAESKKFEELYNKIRPIIYDKNTVIFTHTQKKDWSIDSEPDKKFVYVNGHTHRNEFHDDGEYRIYSDNQIGYRNETPHLKYFLMENDYDFFSDYDDGVHKITSLQYNNFYRGKNFIMNFNREINCLYMLKKNGYYCFIHKANSGTLTILNGGALKRLEEKDVEYYYAHMDKVVSYIRKPIDKYMSIQQEISEEIRKIGGLGKIHGCIIDIDYFNHIYLNPFDLTVTGYWALNMVNKSVYPDVPALLKEKCPAIYVNYLKLIEGDKKNLLVPVKSKKNEQILPKEYLGTDIYKASREIKKMQKLTSNILSYWCENPMQVTNLLDIK